MEYARKMLVLKELPAKYPIQRSCGADGVPVLFGTAVTMRKIWYDEAWVSRVEARSCHWHDAHVPLI